MEVPTDHGVNTVRANEEVAFNAGAVCQVQSDHRSVDRESRRFGAGADRVRPDRVEQGAVQVRPHRHDEWAAEKASWDLDALEHRAVHPAPLSEGRLTRARPDDLSDAEFAQRFHRIRREADT